MVLWLENAQYTEDCVKKIILVVTFALGLMACPGLEYPKIYNIKYEVVGTASRVNLKIRDKNGETSLFSDVSLPWVYEFEAIKRDEYDFISVYVSAQNQGASGSVTTIIYVNGSIKKATTDSGVNAVSTSGSSL